MDLSRLIALLLVATLPACASVTLPDDGPPPGGSTLAAVDDCASLYDAYARWAHDCTGTVLAPTLQSELVDRCAAHAALPGVTVPPGAFASCAERIPGASCAALPLDCLTPTDAEVSRYALPTDVKLGAGSYGTYELFPRVAGTAPLGAACDLGAQCASGHCSSYESCGVCLAYKKPGEACDALAQCTGASACMDGICAASGAGEGEPCQVGKGSSNCRADLYCPKDVCVPRLPVGSPCTGITASETCAGDAVCRDGWCEARVLVPDGEACNDLSRLCGDEGTFCVDGVCRAPHGGVPLGGTCGVDACAFGLVCSYGTCAIGRGVGESCLGLFECSATLTCVYQGKGGAHCLVPGAEGDLCGSMDECGHDLHCDFGATPQAVCTRNATRGEACGNGVPCGSALVCLSGACAELGACSMP